MKILISFIILIVSIHLSHADNYVNDRFSFDLVQDDSGTVNPSVFLPIAWNENWFSGLGYHQSKITTQDSISGFPDSKVSTSSTDKRMRLNFISYQNRINDDWSYSLGADYDFSQIKKSEFGYFHLVTSTVDDYVAFDNNVDIDVSGIDLRGDITWGSKSDFALVRLGMILAPSNKLDIEQTTDVKPIVPTTGTSTSTTSQDLGYQLRLESRFRVLPLLNIGLVAGYELLPLKYDVAILDPSTLNSFTTARVDVHEKTMRLGIRFIFEYETVEKLYPVIGFFNQDIDVEDQGNGSTVSSSDTFVTLGITGAF